MPRTQRARVALAAGAVLLAAACSGPGDGEARDGRPAVTAVPVVGLAASTTPAAELRADLSYLLEEHVHLVSLSTRSALLDGGGAPSATSRSLASAREVNAIALSRVIGKAYPVSESPVLASWRQHVGFFLDYAKAKAVRSELDEAQARSDLDGFRTSFGLLINSFIAGLPANALADDLKPYVDALYTTIDAQVAGERRQFALVQTAAGHMQSAAALLAEGMAGDLKLTETDTPAADLRSGLTALMTRHVYGLGMVLEADEAQGRGDEEQLKAGALDAVDATAVALSEAVGSAYPDARQPFLKSWRGHVDTAVSYASALRGGSTAEAARARSDLEAYPRDFGELISSIVTDLAPALVMSDLQAVVTDLLRVIESDVVAEPGAATELRVAASRMPKTAATLAGGIAQHKKLS